MATGIKGTRFSVCWAIQLGRGSSTAESLSCGSWRCDFWVPGPHGHCLDAVANFVVMPTTEFCPQELPWIQSPAMDGVNWALGKCL